MIGHVEGSEERDVSPVRVGRLLAPLPTAEKSSGWVEVGSVKGGAEQRWEGLALEHGDFVRAKDGRRAADDVLKVLVEHPGVDGERFAKLYTVTARVAKLQGAIVGDGRDGDQVRKLASVVTSRSAGGASARTRSTVGSNFAPKLSEPEESANCRVGPFQCGGDARVMRGREHGDVATDRGEQRDVRQDEDRFPVIRHGAQSYGSSPSRPIIRSPS